MAIIEQNYYQLDDLKLSALTFGKKSQQPVLCLHGYLDNAASFIPLMQDELLHGKYIIALEWPGHGHSDHRSADAHYHFFDYVSDLKAMFTLNNWQEIDIVAHSMGAMVASAFAAAFPEKVRSLTLIDCYGFICAPIEETTKQLRQGILSREKPAKQSRNFSEDTAVKARMHASDLQKEHADLIVLRSLKASKSGSDLYNWCSDPRLRRVSPYRLSLAQARQILSDIKCPIQLIYGDKGMKMVLNALNDFSDCINNLTTTELPGGHHVHMEQPKALSSLLIHFIEDK